MLKRVAYSGLILGLLGVSISLIWIFTSSNNIAQSTRTVWSGLSSVFGPVIVLWLLFLLMGISLVLILVPNLVSRRKEIDLKSRILVKEVTFDLIEVEPQAAVARAFIVFEQTLRNRLRADADLPGSTLINKAFGKDGVLTYGKTTGEDEGVRSFMAGAYAIFRNPSSHRILNLDEFGALRIIQVVDMMMIMLDDSHSR